VKKGALLLIFVLAGCGGPSEESVVPRFSAQELEAKYYSDLGAPFAMVGSYPKEVQEQYQVFLRVCSQCHSVGRALYSGVVERDDWRRYVRRMHERGKSREWWSSVPKESFGDIVDFLAYDAKVRKVERKEEFELEVSKLKEYFRAVEAERVRLRSASNNAAARSADYTGVK
jgi:hypothetical protein